MQALAQIDVEAENIAGRHALQAAGNLNTHVAVDGPPDGRRQVAAPVAIDERPIVGQACGRAESRRSRTSTL